MGFNSGFKGLIDIPCRTTLQDSQFPEHLPDTSVVMSSTKSPTADTVFGQYNYFLCN